ncbi:MAG: hypothetical protein AAB360_01480 [Patescibacteria group bacterium]
MERERVTISIKKDVLARVDQTVDGVSIRNRSHAIEHLITSAVGPANTKNAVILVGGRGAVKILPAIRDILYGLRDNGFGRVYIALGSMAGNFKNDLGNGENFDLDIEYLEGGEGSGGALLPLKKKFKDTFIVINPDEDTPKINLAGLVQFHKNHRVIATIGTDNLNEMRGIYVFEPELFNHLPKDFSMLEDDIFPKLAGVNQLIVYPTIAAKG